MSPINPGYLTCSKVPHTFSDFFSLLPLCNCLSGLALGIHCATSRRRSLPAWSLCASGELAEPVTQAALACARRAAHRVTLCQTGASGGRWPVPSPCPCPPLIGSKRTGHPKPPKSVSSGHCSSKDPPDLKPRSRGSRMKVQI